MSISNSSTPQLNSISNPNMTSIHYPQRQLLSPQAWTLFLLSLMVLCVLVPISNLLIPSDSVFHLSDYAVGLIAKIMCYALCALAIDLIWKSSEIEGNTYSLLETEALIKQHELAKGKSKEDATMLLNHKKALDFITDDLDYLKPLTVNKIIDIHTLLIGGLGVSNNIRRRAVAITGTNYRPLSIETQIKEELEEIVNLVNSKNNIFEKGLLLLCLLSYLQAFEDGNKRTARIMSNAVLMSHNYCPLSFRTVSAVDYKKAMLLFYEQNNISAMKEIFIHQYEFAVKQYFDL